MRIRRRPLVQLARVSNCGGDLCWNTSHESAHALQVFLVQILTYDFDLEDFQASLERWEAIIKRHDEIADEPVQSAVKTATVISRMPKGPLQDHLLVNSSRLGDYTILRTEVNEILRAQRHLLRTPGSWGANGSQPVPMEIGAFNSGRDARFKDLTCHSCGRKGHKSSECPNKGQAAAAGGKVGKAGKAKGKGKDKGKIKGKMGQDKN